MRRLLTGTGISERMLWESRAVRDQLRRDVPTTPRGWSRSGVEAATWPGGRAAACMTAGSEQCMQCVALRACGHAACSDDRTFFRSRKMPAVDPGSTLHSGSVLSSKKIVT